MSDDFYVRLISAENVDKNRKYPDACKEIAGRYFPKEICDCISHKNSTNSQIVMRYASIVGMNEGGANKNIRILRMLLDDARKTPAEASEYLGLDDSEDKKDESTTREGLRFDKGEATAAIEPHEDGAMAKIDITLPVERLSDAMVALLSAVNQEAASIEMSIIGAPNMMNSK